MQGIQNGNLHVDNYTQYMVQDIAYLKHGADNWYFAAKLAKQQNKLQIEEYCIKRGDRWLQYALGLSTKYHVKLDGIIIGKELEEYMEYESYIVSKYGPEYIFIAVYACVKLWPFIANELKKDVHIVINKDSKIKKNQINKNNIYQFWIEGNLSEKSSVRTATWLNELYQNGKIDKKMALEIISNCIRLEINFFKQACQEQSDQIDLYQFELDNNLNNPI